MDTLTPSRKQAIKVIPRGERAKVWGEPTRLVVSRGENRPYY
jgi:hypothetical protein